MSIFTCPRNVLSMVVNVSCFYYIMFYHPLMVANVSVDHVGLGGWKILNLGLLLLISCNRS